VLIGRSFGGIVSPVPSNDYGPVDSLLRDVRGESE
jgi:hypothetical protein